MKVFNEDDRQLESILRDFETAWDRGDAQIEQFLPEDHLLERVLVELVGADLELRTAAGQPARVEDYLDRFPLLKENPSQLAELVQLEFELRSRREPKLQTGEYLARFGSLAAQGLLAHLPGAGSPAAGSSADAIGQRTTESGRFRLLRPYGEGGLGNVWIAYDEELGREVAVKEIKHKFADDPENRARFLQEVTITGGLQHPGIVSVYGTGNYPDGRPFYAMRLVHGKTLQSAIESFHATDWKAAGEAQRNVQLQRLLRYLLNVCQTTDYAHRQGILHRDIKPANIMIGQYGETVMLDWGLAKLLHAKEKTTTEFEDSVDAAVPTQHEESTSSKSPSERSSSGADIQTRLGGVIGSPAYMSPEQARGEHDRLTVRADVYCLGAVLYCMLTNQPPLTGSRSDQLLERAKSSDWQPPSRVAAHVPRPLEAVCVKAMAANPKQRYASAKLLADDLERFLADEAVQAYREAPLERLTRFGRRHRGIVWAAAAALVLITVLAVASAIAINEQRDLAAQRARAEMRVRSQAQQFGQQAHRVRKLLVDSLSTPVPESLGRNVKVVEVLDHAVNNIESHLPDDVVVGAEVLDTAARTYLRLDILDRAVECAERAVRLLTPERDEHPRELLAAQTTLAEVCTATGHIYEALETQIETAATVEAEFGLNNLETIRAINALAAAWQAAGEPHKVVKLLEPRWHKLDASSIDQTSTWSVAVNLCEAYRNTGRLEEALELAQRLYEFGQSAFPDSHPDYDRIRENLALSHTFCGQHPAAIAILQDTYDRRVQTEGPEHPLTVDALSSLGVVHIFAGKEQRAVEIFEEVLAIRDSRLDTSHPALLHTRQNLAQAIYQLSDGKKEEYIRRALELNKETLALAEQSKTPDRELIHILYNNMATNVYALGQVSEAVAYTEQAVDGLRDHLGLQHPTTLVAIDNLVGMYFTVGRTDEAKALIDEAIDACQRQHGENFRLTLQLRSKAASLALNEGQPAVAVAILQDVVPRCEEHLGKISVTTFSASSTLRWALIAVEQFELAESLTRDSFVTYQHPPEKIAWDVSIAVSQVQLAESLLGQDQVETAEPFADIALEFLADQEKVHGVEAHARAAKAACFMKRNEFIQAEGMLQQAADLLAQPDKRMDAASNHTRRVVNQRFIDLYEAWDKPAEAEPFRQALQALPG